MKSVNYGTIARVFRDTRPENEDTSHYEQWVKDAIEMGRNLEAMNLQGFDFRVFLHKCGAEEVKHIN